MGAVYNLGRVARFVAGSHLNLYNGDALQWMHGLGANRWVAPLELRREDLAVLQAQRPAGLQTEVFAFGRLPLAYSALLELTGSYGVGFVVCSVPALLVGVQLLRQRP